MPVIPHDVRFAIRALSTRPGPTSLIVLTLAVTIGAATIVFGLIDLVWHVVPIANRERMVFVASTDSRAIQGNVGGARRSRVSIPDFVDWSERAMSFEELSGLAFGSATLTEGNVPMRVSVARVTVDLPQSWGLMPVMGRSFRSNEDQDPVTLVTHQFWQRQLGGAADVLGQTQNIDGTSHTIIGVLPSESSVGLLQQTDLILPLALRPSRSGRDDRTLFVTGRLKPGVTREQASAELSRIAQQLEREHPDTNGQIGAIVQPLIEASGMSVRALLAILIGVAALLVIMACANIANIILAQMTGRRREFTVRAALGESRWRCLRQLVVEHFLLATAAGLIGIAFGAAGIGILRWLAGNTFGFSDMTVNWRVVVAALTATFIAPLAFGVFPVLTFPRIDPNELRQGARAISSARVGVMRRLMTAAQVGVAVILTVHIALLARTAWRLSALDTGFDPAQLLTFRLNVPAEATRARQFLRDLIESVARVPGVASVAIVDRLPIADSEVIRRLTIEGSTESRPELMPTAAVSGVSSGYFETMRIPVRRGRSLTMQDLTDVRLVALVNEEAVRKYWPGQNPIDRRVRFEDQGVWFTIVGVVGNVRNSDASSGPLPEMYVPASLRPPATVAVVLRAERGDPLLIVPSLRAAMASIAPTEPIFDVASMNTVIFDDIAGTLILVSILTIVAIVALCLAASGVYGVVSYSVSQRTREIGVRLALGATPAAVVDMVTRQGLMPVVVGATIGLSLAIALAFLALRPLGDVEVRDPLSYTIVTLSILAIAVIASYIPARRASRLDPMSILRHE